jgi:chaperonin GroEL (HSP60 family)
MYCDFKFAEISKVQDDEVGDGTTSVTVLACELLKVLVQSD